MLPGMSGSRASGNRDNWPHISATWQQHSALPSGWLRKQMPPTISFFTILVELKVNKVLKQNLDESKDPKVFEGIWDDLIAAFWSYTAANL